MATGALQCATLCYMGTRRRRSVGIRELRQNLSVYLEQVKKGRSLMVTEHGRPVAELRPVTASVDVLERLARDGLATRAKRRPADLPQPVILHLERPLRDLLDDLREDRV
jgi:prevent-host-death family protein